MKLLPCIDLDRLNMSGYGCLMKRRKDDLDAYVDEREAREPGFRAKAIAAEKRAEARLKLGQMLREARGEHSQTWVAARMQTSESIVRRIERGDDVRFSTLEKYAQALGKELRFSLR